MRDCEIRACLRALLHEEHGPDDDTLIVDELGLLQGAARVDIAVVNGALAGWEIKSDQDTLQRLSAQATAYSRVFDEVTLVVAAGHLAKAKDVIPSWWGLSVALESETGHVKIAQVRNASANPATDPRAQAELLWRDEALEILKRHGLDVGLRSKQRRILWTALAEHLEPDELAKEVRAALRSRQDWRGGAPRP